MPKEEDYSALTAAAAAAPQAVSSATLAAMASKMGLGSEMAARADMAGLIIRDLYELYQNTATPCAGADMQVDLFGIEEDNMPSALACAREDCRSGGCRRPADPGEVAPRRCDSADMQVAELDCQLAVPRKRCGAPEREGPASAKRAAFTATIGDSEDEDGERRHVYVRGRRPLAV